MSNTFPISAGQLHQQRFRIRAWVRTRLWAQVVLGLVLGLVVGALLGPDFGLLAPERAEALGGWLALPGQIFLGLIAMVLVPLVFASIVQGLNGAGSGAELREIGLRLGLFIIATTLLAAWIGVGLVEWLRPGAGFAASGPAVAAVAPVERGFFEGARAPDVIAGILPSNPTASIVKGDMLAVVVLAMLVGIACLQISEERAAPFLRLLESLLTISMVIVKWAMFLAPFAVFGLMAQLVLRSGLGTVAALWEYVAIVLLGLSVLMAVYLLAIAILARVSPFAFLKSAAANLLLAFSTSSSSAVMPVTLDTAIKRFGVPPATANIVVPLGATMNMAGTALYQSVAILFLAQLAGIDLSGTEVGLIVVTLVASSIGAPGTPGVSIAILASVAAGFGIPPEGLVIILGVDRLLDMARTTVNVAGDLAACVVLRKVGAPAVAPGSAKAGGGAAET